MATRRNVPQTQVPERTISESQGGPPSGFVKSDTRPAIPRDVVVKLLLFTLAMIIVPIGSYFTTLNIIFRGEHPYRARIQKTFGFLHTLSISSSTTNHDHWSFDILNTPKSLVSATNSLKRRSNLENYTSKGRTNVTGNSTYAGGFAAIMANVVLIGYIIVAVREDSGEEWGPTGVNALKEKVDSKKGQ